MRFPIGTTPNQSGKCGRAKAQKPSTDGALLVAASVAAAIRLRGEPVQPSPRLTTGCSRRGLLGAARNEAVAEVGRGYFGVHVRVELPQRYSVRGVNNRAEQSVSWRSRNPVLAEPVSR